MSVQLKTDRYFAFINNSINEYMSIRNSYNAHKKKKSKTLLLIQYFSPPF
jgi:hypothetical protein